MGRGIHTIKHVLTQTRVYIHRYTHAYRHRHTQALTHAYGYIYCTHIHTHTLGYGNVEKAWPHKVVPVYDKVLHQHPQGEEQVDSSEEVEYYSEPVLKTRPKCPYCFLKSHICTVRERREVVRQRSGGGVKDKCVWEGGSSLVGLPQVAGHFIIDQQEQVHQE